MGGWAGARSVKVSQATLENLDFIQSAGRSCAGALLENGMIHFHSLKPVLAPGYMLTWRTGVEVATEEAVPYWTQHNRKEETTDSNR